MESLLAALGDTRRLRALRRLARWDGSASQAELRAALGLGDNEKSGLSRDLERLVAAGLASEEPRKRYTAMVNVEELEDLLRQVARLDTELARRRAARAEQRERELGQEETR